MPKLYRLTTIVRPNEGPGPEHMVLVTVKARSKRHARRVALEMVWANECLVTRFLDIKRVTCK